jgi:AraC family transcriptional activator of pobA
VSIQLYDPRKGEPSIVFSRLAWAAKPFEPARTNHFSIYWIVTAAGSVAVDAAVHPLQPRSLLFLSPYRRVRFNPTRPVTGALIQFHANFLCVETFHAESGCSGSLFNDPFGTPAVILDRPADAAVKGLVQQIERELTDQRRGHDEVVVASLKILLVMATRLKGEPPAHPSHSHDHRHPLLARLTTLIEQRYRTLHRPSDYAVLLNMSQKTLTRFVRTQFGKTMTELIRERLLIDAKWELLHTLKPVKEIAGELGFDDELYFSRLFKKAVGRSPTDFREFETAVRGGSNLSMSLSGPPIPPQPGGG